MFCRFLIHGRILSASTEIGPCRRDHAAVPQERTAPQFIQRHYYNISLAEIQSHFHSFYGTFPTWAWAAVPLRPAPACGTLDPQERNPPTPIAPKGASFYARCPSLRRSGTSPYAKYFYQDMAPIPQDKLDIWHGPMADPALATPVEAAQRFPGRGQGGPGGGLYRGPQRHRLCGQQHLHARRDAGDVRLVVRLALRGPRPALSDLGPGTTTSRPGPSRPTMSSTPPCPGGKRPWGVTHDIMEDIGLGMERLLLQFCKPSDLGYDMSKVGTPSCAAMVCAVGREQLPRPHDPQGGPRRRGHLVQVPLLDGLRPGRGWGSWSSWCPTARQCPRWCRRALFGHCIKEFSNLAAILPSLYAEEKDRL